MGLEFLNVLGSVLLLALRLRLFTLELMQRDLPL